MTVARLNDEQQRWINAAERSDVNGWIHLRIGGEPFERGFQHGFLVARDYAEALRVYSAMTYQTYGMDYAFFQEHAVAMHKDKLGDELTQELEGMAAGLTAAGVASTLDDMIGWNAWMELTEYWWPANHEKFATSGPDGPRHGHCSAFIATGAATKDGRIVIGHESFTDFWAGQVANVLLDITPADGHRMVMQASPCYLGSMQDFWVMSSGLAVIETTIGNFRGYDEAKTPEYVRVRNACQHANTIDEWVALMNKDDNGGYANSWLIGDINTNEIARYEEGLVYQNLERKTDGYFHGENVVYDPRIRNLECGPMGFNDVRQSTGARRVRWEQLLTQHHGEITAEIGMRMLGDTYDVYALHNRPGGNTICAQNDMEPGRHGGPAPYSPFGSVDGKVADAADIARVAMWGRFGRASGMAFDADAFLTRHPQWNWQSGYLASRPTQPWTHFDAAAVTTGPL